MEELDPSTIKDDLLQAQEAVAEFSQTSELSNEESSEQTQLRDLQLNRMKAIDANAKGCCVLFFFVICLTLLIIILLKRNSPNSIITEAVCFNNTVLCPPFNINYPCEENGSMISCLRDDSCLPIIPHDCGLFGNCIYNRTILSYNCNCETSYELDDDGLCVRTEKLSSSSSFMFESSSTGLFNHSFVISVTSS